MYICPTCKREFQTKKAIQKHFLACWKEQNPFHKSKEAPHSEDINVREASNEVNQFFARFNNG